MSPQTNQIPLRFDVSGVLATPGGVSQKDLDQLRPKLEKARDELEVDRRLFATNDTIPAEKQPLDAGFVDLPGKLLSDYQSDRENSELAAILKTATRIRETSDRVVLLGIGGSYMGARALMDSCCQPYHNELSRAERGGVPRIYFEGNNVDNDHSQALLKMLAGASEGQQAGNDDWSIVVISKSGGTLETAVAFRQFHQALSERYGNVPNAVAERIVPITGEVGKLASLADKIGCTDRYLVPDGVGGRFSILSAVGLLPAAIMGLDVVSLLQGAVAMTARFRDSAIGDNPVLDYVGVCHLLEANRGIDERVMSVWSKSLETMGLWYDQLLAESLGKREQGALPLTVVNTRDLHSRAQQHQEGSRNKVMTNVILESWKDDPLRVGFSEHDDDGLNQISDKTLADIMTAAIKGTNQAYQSDNRPTMDIRLAKADEHSLGQFFQMLMLATVAEGRLVGTNPYGQPGVEMYKINMKRNLSMPG